MGRKPKDDLKGYLIIVNHFIQYGKPPSFQMIADKLGYASKRSVQLLLKRLEVTGHITYADGRISLVHNANELTGGEQTVSIPVLGTVPCGPPDLAEQNIEAYVDVSTTVATPGSKYFILRAKGNSMDREGINPGDLMLIREQASADDGDIVLALVDDEATVKYFRRENGFVVLRPNSTNPNNKPVILSREFVIQGKFIATLPKTF